VYLVLINEAVVTDSWKYNITTGGRGIAAVMFKETELRPSGLEEMPPSKLILDSSVSKLVD
jgi:hypothetical protein